MPLDFGNIESGQQRLETVATGKESPQALKAKLVQYRQTYRSEVNAQKNSLKTFQATFKSTEAKDYLDAAATGLGSKVLDLAAEGEVLQKKGIDAKKARGEELTAAELGFASLDSLKASLQTELTAEKAEVTAFQKLEKVDTARVALASRDEKINTGSSLANLSSNLALKQANRKNLTAIYQEFNTTSSTPATTAMRNSIKEALDELIGNLDDDIDHGIRLVKVQEDLAKKGTEITALASAIAKIKKPISSADYDSHLAKLKSASRDLSTIYENRGKAANTTSPFIEGPAAGLYTKLFQPVSEKLQNLYQDLESKRPAGSVEKPDPLAQANLDAAKARQEFAGINTAIGALEKELAGLQKDQKKSLNRVVYDDFNKRLDALIGRIDKTQQTSQVAAMLMSPDQTIVNLGKEINDRYYQPALDRATDLQTKNTNRESEIRDSEREQLNKTLADLLPKMDSSWQESVTNQKQFLAAAPGSDENSQEYKDHLAGESKIFSYLISSEAQISSILSKEASGDLKPENLQRFKAYQSLCKTNLELIIANRATRKMNKAAAAEQDQVHSYRVLIDSKKAIRYVPDPTDPKGRIAEEYMDNTYEDRQDTYKFTDCVEFIDPGNPKYKEINGGKGWRFKKDGLPQSVIERMTLQAARVVTDARDAAEVEARQEKQTIISEQKLFDRTREELGDSAKEYFSAFDAMAKGDVSGAIALYHQYIEKAKGFPPEDKKKHETYLQDAQRQIDSYDKSAEFYNGMALMKGGKLDEAIVKFRVYIEKIQKGPEADRKTCADQLNIAIEVVKKFNSAKLDMLVDLEKDVKYAQVISIIKSQGSGRDILDRVKKIRANSQAAAEGRKPPFKPEDCKIAGDKRLLLLPYLPYDQLTKSERQLVDNHQAGLTGEEPAKLDAGIRKIRDRIAKGEPLDFDDELKKLQTELSGYSNPKNHPAATTYQSADGTRKVESTSARLFDLFANINTTDNGKREKGFVAIADYFKDDSLGMQYTQKYLSKAMHYRYQEFEEKDGGATKREVTKRMLADPMVAADVHKAATEYYQRWVTEHNSKPGADKIALNPPDPFVLQQFQKQFFEQRLQSQYERDMRHKMTEQGLATAGSALEGFNASLPYDDGSGRWYKPWSWSNYNEDDWNDFKDQAQQLLVETVATLPIGFGAGAIGKMAGRTALKLLLKESMSSAALEVIERGGIMALRSNSAIWEGLSPALKEAVMNQTKRIALGYGAGLAAEGGSMLVMSSIWEGLSTGHNPEFFEALETGKWRYASLTLLESIAKVGCFRAIGAGQSKILQAAGADAGAGAKVATAIAAEGFSGVAGTGLEALSLIYKGRGDEVTFDFWAKGIIQNALQAYALGKGHRAFGEKQPGRSSKRQQREFQRVESELLVERLGQKGIKAPTDIHEVIPLPDGGLIINGQRINLTETPLTKMPEPIRLVIEKQITKFKADKFSDNLKANGIVKPSDIIAIDNGRIITREGAKVTVDDPSLLPPEFHERYQELRKAEVKDKFLKLAEADRLLAKRDKLEQDRTANTDKLAEIKTSLDGLAKELGMTPEQLSLKTHDQMRVYQALDRLYTSEKQFYRESKIVKKPLLNADGTPKLGADHQPLFENINLFSDYESKTSAYSSEMLVNLTHERLMAEGGCRIIKIGGDELVVYHAGPGGKIQKLFIDISNMGPTNDTATNITGSKVNLVDIYLHKISGRIKAESLAHQGKYLDAIKFNDQIATSARELFSLDRDDQGLPVSSDVARKKFKVLQDEWHLDGTYEQYQADINSMRILAEYRADTRSLDASFKGKKGITFSEHIAQEIQDLSGMSIVEIQKMISVDPKHFQDLIDARVPKSSKLTPMSSEKLMLEIAQLNPQKSKPGDMMMLYSLLARLDTAKMSTVSAFKPLADKLNVTRQELTGVPPHSRIEAPRLMDAKVVSIDLPKDVMDALNSLAKTDPASAQAILTTARTLSEKPLDALKYSADKTRFARFNIMDHIELVNGKIVIKEGATEFREAYDINRLDKKVTNIDEIEKGLAVVKKNLEELRSRFEKGLIPKPEYELKLEQIKREITMMEDKSAIDPDTNAYKQGYMDVKPTRMYTFPDGVISSQHRIWDTVTTELSHAGVINSKYGYLGMDKNMTAYHQVLKSGIAAELPAHLQHFKVIRGGGGKFEIAFLDSRSIEALQQKGLTPESLVRRIAEGKGQTEVDKILSADPQAVEYSKSDAAVRDSQSKYNKGKAELEVGKLTVKAEVPISHVEIEAILEVSPNASQRELIGEVIERRKIAKLNDGLSASDTPRELAPGERELLDHKPENQPFDAELEQAIKDTRELESKYKEIHSRLKYLEDVALLAQYTGKDDPAITTEMEQLKVNLEKYQRSLDFERGLEMNARREFVQDHLEDAMELHPEIQIATLQELILKNPNTYERVIYLSKQAGQLEAMGLKQAARDLQDLTADFASVDGSPLKTAEQRAAFLEKLLKLSPLEHEWYETRPETTLDADSPDYQENFNKLKDFNAKFLSEKVLPELIARGLSADQLILEIHRWQTRGAQAQLEVLLSPEEGYDISGKTREVQVSVGEYIAPIAGRVPELLGQLSTNMQKIETQLSDLKTGDPAVYEKAVVKAAFYALQTFVEIHPMRDGNGRTGRALYEYYIVKFLGPESKYRRLPMEKDDTGESSLHSEMRASNAKLSKTLYKGKPLDRLEGLIGDQLSQKIEATDLQKINSDPLYEEFFANYNKLMSSFP